MLEKDPFQVFSFFGIRFSSHPWLHHPISTATGGPRKVHFPATRYSSTSASPQKISGKAPRNYRTTKCPSVPRLQETPSQQLPSPLVNRQCHHSVPRLQPHFWSPVTTRPHHPPPSPASSPILCSATRSPRLSSRSGSLPARPSSTSAGSSPPPPSTSDPPPTGSSLPPPPRRYRRPARRTEPPYLIRAPLVDSRLSAMISPSSCRSAAVAGCRVPCRSSGT